MSIWGDVVVTPLEKAYLEADMEPFYKDDDTNGMDTTPAWSKNNQSYLFCYIIYGFYSTPNFYFYVETISWL